MSVDLPDGIRIYNISWTKTRDGTPKLRLFITDQDGYRAKPILLDLPLKPFFFATPEAVKEKPLPEGVVSEIVQTNRGPLVKVICNEPDEVVGVREYLGVKNTFEADVPYGRRVMIERDMTVSAPRRRLYVDIETDPRGGIPDVEEASRRIISVGAVDQDGNEYFFSDENEQAMLGQFLLLLEKFPVVGTWYGNHFDWPYLQARAEKLELKFYWDSVIHIDLLAVYKYVLQKKQDQYSLEFIAEKEKLKHRKAPVTIEELWPSFGGDKVKLRSRNITDAWIAQEVDQKLTLTDIMFTIAKSTHTSVKDLLRVNERNTKEWNPSVAIDGLALFLSSRREPRIVWPTKQYKEDADPEDKFIGALVLDPVVGIHRNIITLDVHCHLPGTVVQTTTGPKHISEIREGDEVFYIDGWTRVSKVHTKNYTGHMMRLTTRSGRTLGVTPWHKIPTHRAGVDASLRRLRDVKACTLRKNSNVLVSSLEFYERDDFSEFVGIVAAEGHTHTKDYPYYDKKRGTRRVSHQNAIQITISSEEDEFRTEIDRLVEKLHGSRISWRSRVGSRGITVAFNDKKLLTSITEWYERKHSKAEIASFLRGMFEGDGTVNLRHRSISLTQSTNNENKMNLARRFLDTLGIRYCVSKVGFTNPGPLASGYHERFVLDIASRSDIMRFLSSVGFISNRKRCRASAISKKRDTSQNLWYQDERVLVEAFDYSGPVVDLTLEDADRPYFLADGVLSHNSLYPSIIRSLNVGVDTYRPDGSGDVIAPIGSFVSSPESIMAEGIRSITEMREHYRRQKAELDPSSSEYKTVFAQDFAMKVVINSVYGVSGSRHSRYYNKDVAENVTLTGRRITAFMKQELERVGYPVIYGDTDSVFCKTREDDPDIVGTAQFLAMYMTERVREFIEETFHAKSVVFELEVDKICSTMFMPRAFGKGEDEGVKKRYAGLVIWQGKPTVYLLTKGFEVARHDWPQPVKDAQEQGLWMKVTDATLDEQVAMANDWKRRLFTGELTPVLALNKGINKQRDEYKVLTPFLRVAKMLEEKGLARFVKGDTVAYIKTGPKPDQIVPVVDGVAIDLSTGKPYVFTEKDYGYIWDHLFKPIFDRLEIPVEDEKLRYATPRQRKNLEKKALAKGKVLADFEAKPAGPAFSPGERVRVIDQTLPAGYPGMRGTVESLEENGLVKVDFGKHGKYSLNPRQLAPDYSVSELKEQNNVIVGIVERLAAMDMKGAIQNDVVAEAVKVGLPKAVVEDILERLLGHARLFEPTPGRIIIV